MFLKIAVIVIVVLLAIIASNVWINVVVNQVATCYRTLLVGDFKAKLTFKIKSKIVNSGECSAYVRTILNLKLFRLVVMLDYVTSNGIPAIDINKLYDYIKRYDGRIVTEYTRPNSNAKYAKDGICYDPNANYPISKVLVYFDKFNSVVPFNELEVAYNTDMKIAEIIGTYAKG